ncbi:MAG: PAS domain S-box protein [Gemmatimonadales bacterium]|nr:MAG: PAS domain S-box protein [Gemmatimonadales bacterium]
MPGSRRSPTPPLFSRWVVAFASVFGLLLLLLLGLSFLGIYGLSGIRGYVLGEGLWSKAQKRSVIALQQYAFTGDARFHRAFREEIEITRGDRQAREELERPDPDMSVVREGFLRGQIPDAAITPMARVFRWGRNIGFVDRSIEVWDEGDRAIEELVALAESLHVELKRDIPDSLRVLGLLGEIGEVDERLTELEEDFSRTFNEGAAQVEQALFAALTLLTVSLLVAGVLGTRFFLRQIKRRDEALRRSETRYRELFERNVVGVLLAADDGSVMEVNEAFARALGYPDPKEMEGRSVRDFLSVEPLELTESRDPRVIPARGAGGIRRYLLLAATPVRTAGDPGEQILVTATDVTDRHVLEERLARARKMEAMGQLAGGVAHDFNNLLTVVLGHAQILEADLRSQGTPDPAIMESIAEIVRTSGTAAGLTRQLLTFSRSRVMEQRVIDVNEAVEAAHSLITRLLPSMIECRVELTRRLEPVKLSPVHLEQLLLNMTINARDAMVEGGVLTLRTGMRSVSEGRRTERLELSPGTYVVLEIEDTGHGMDSETVARIFEPFFTTKDQERGTGMGLATVYGIVTQAGGTIDVRTAPGEGTTFTIYLPAFPSVASAGSAESS